ncbi:hypothetical protein RFI_37443, partial [Reticulomyxa filosa]
RVVVINKQSEKNEDEQHVWKIKASGTFRVRNDSDNPYLIKRGTEINFKKIVKKHSQFVIFPINLLTIKKEEKVLCLCFICFEYTYIHVGGKCFSFFFLRQKKKMCELLFVPKKARYHSIKSSELTSFKEYVCKMKRKQKHTYYITDFNVLFLVDYIDGSAVQQLLEYDGKKFVCTKVGLDLPLTEGEKKVSFFLKVYLFKKKTLRIIVAYESLTKKMKEILGHKVEKVIVVYRMVYLPCSLATRKYGWSANIERIIKAQALRDKSMTQYVQSKITIEIDPNHAIVGNLKEKFAADPFDKIIKDLVLLLFETALLASGFSLEKPVKFAGRIHKLMNVFFLQVGVFCCNVWFVCCLFFWCLFCSIFFLRLVIFIVVKNSCHLFNFVVMGAKKLSLFLPKLYFLNFKFYILKINLL